MRIRFRKIVYTLLVGGFAVGGSGVRGAYCNVVLVGGFILLGVGEEGIEVRNGLGDGVGGGKIGSRGASRSLRTLSAEAAMLRISVMDAVSWTWL